MKCSLLSQTFSVLTLIIVFSWHECYALSVLFTFCDQRVTENIHPVAVVDTLTKLLITVIATVHLVRELAEVYITCRVQKVRLLNPIDGRLESSEWLVLSAAIGAFGQGRSF